MSDIMIEIQELYYQGMDARAIAEKIGFPIEVMVEVIERYCAEWNEDCTYYGA